MGGFRYAIGGAIALLGTIALTANSYLLATGAMRWAHEHDMLERAALGAGGAIVPWALALLPIVFLASGRSGRFVIALLWVIFFAYNFLMGASNIAKMREDTVAVASHGADVQSAAKQRRADLQAQLDAIPSHRPPTAIEPLLEAQHHHRSWQSTNGCTDVTRNASRAFCDAYRALESERASGMAALELSREIAAIDTQIAQAPPTTGASADPWVDTLSDATGWGKRTIRTGFAMLTPFILEVLGATFLKYAFALFGLSLTVQQTAPSQPPIQLLSPEAINRTPIDTLDQLTRGRQLCEWFWRECAKPNPGGSMAESDWYEQYQDICRRHNSSSVPVDNFRRIAARNVGLIIQDIDGVKHYQGYLPYVPERADA